MAARNFLTNILFEMYNPNCSMEDLMFENGWIEVKYKCQNCGAEDVDRRLADDHAPIPQVCNCWKCGAGRGLDPVDMMHKHKGMVAMAIPSVVSNVNPGRIAVVERHPN